MKVTLTLPDDAVEKYQSRLRPTQSLEQVLTLQLLRFANVDPRDRIIIIGPEERGQLEEATTRLPLTTAADLVKRVQALAEVSIGQVRFRWTPRQYAELKAKAERWGMPVRDYAEKVVRQIEEGFFSETPKPGQIVEPSPDAAKEA
jgi:hypothetical protein